MLLELSVTILTHVVFTAGITVTHHHMMIVKHYGANNHTTLHTHARTQIKHYGATTLHYTTHSCTHTHYAYLCTNTTL